MLQFQDSVSPLSRLRAMLCFRQHPMMSPVQFGSYRQIDKDTSGLENFIQNLLKGKFVKLVPLIADEILPDQIPRWMILHCPSHRPLTLNSLSQPHLNSLPHSPPHHCSPASR